MSKDAKPAEGAEAAVPATPKSKKLIIIIAAAVLILAIGGAAAFMLLKKAPEETGDEEDATETAKPSKKDTKKKDAHPPVFVTLEPFTVNLIPETGDQYLQVSLSVEIEDPAAEGHMKASMPKIRNAIMLLLSSKKASELTSREGKEHLAGELKETINSLMAPHDEEPAPKKKGKKQAVEEPEGPAKEVLFTSFIIQ